MDTLRKICSSYRSGTNFLDALEKEEKRSPGVCGRLEGHLVALLQEAAVGLDTTPKPGPIEEEEEEARSTFTDISSVVPRGKLQIDLRKSGLAMKGPKINLQLSFGAIHKIAVLEGMPYSNKKVYVMVSINRKAAVMHGKQKIQALLLSADQSHVITIKDPLNPSECISGGLGIVLFQALTKMGVASSAMLKPGLFSSNAGRKAVSCVVRVNQGWLFPMESAICFVERPPMLLDHADILTVQPDRTESWNTTFDLMVYLADGDFLHLQQIDTSELNCLVTYFKTHKIKIGVPDEPESPSADRSCKNRQVEKSSKVEEQTSDSEDCSDEDFNPDRSSGDDDDDGPAMREQEGYEVSSNEPGSTDSDGAEIVSEDDVPASVLAEWIDSEARNASSNKATKRNEFSGPGGSGSQR